MKRIIAFILSSLGALFSSSANAQWDMTSKLGAWQGNVVLVCAMETVTDFDCFKYNGIAWTGLGRQFYNGISRQNSGIYFSIPYSGHSSDNIYFVGGWAGASNIQKFLIDPGAHPNKIIFQNVFYPPCTTYNCPGEIGPRLATAYDGTGTYVFSVVPAGPPGSDPGELLALYDVPLQQPNWVLRSTTLGWSFDTANTPIAAEMAQQLFTVHPYWAS